MKTLYDLLLEALKDEIPEYQKNALLNISPAYKYQLDRDYKKSDFVKDQKIKLTPKEQKKAISTFFQFDATSVYELIRTFMQSVDDIDMFYKIMKTCQAIDYDIDFSEIFISDIRFLLQNNFHTMSIVKNIESVPEQYRSDIININDVNVKINKNQNVNINAFLASYNKAFGKNIVPVFTDKQFSAINSTLVSAEFQIDDLINSQMYIYISGKAIDVLNMSISKFYDSCQNLYSGGYNRQLLANVFDRNMKVCYFMFEMPWADSEGNDHEYLSFSRTILRNTTNKIFVDRGYPDRMRAVFYNILKTRFENVTMKSNEVDDDYKMNFLDISGLESPYMDNLSVSIDTIDALKDLDKKDVADVFTAIMTLASSASGDEESGDYQEEYEYELLTDRGPIPSMGNAKQFAGDILLNLSRLNKGDLKNVFSKDQLLALLPYFYDKKFGLLTQDERQYADEMLRKLKSRKIAKENLNSLPEYIQLIALYNLSAEYIKYIDNQTDAMIEIAINNSWTNIKFIKNPSKNLQTKMIDEHGTDVIEMINNISPDVVYKVAKEQSLQALSKIKIKSDVLRDVVQKIIDFSCAAVIKNVTTNQNILNFITTEVDVQENVKFLKKLYDGNILDISYIQKFATTVTNVRELDWAEKTINVFGVSIIENNTLEKLMSGFDGMAAFQDRMHIQYEDIPVDVLKNVLKEQMNYFIAVSYGRGAYKGEISQDIISFMRTLPDFTPMYIPKRYQTSEMIIEAFKDNGSAMKSILESNLNTINIDIFSELPEDILDIFIQQKSDYDLARFISDNNDVSESFQRKAIAKYPRIIRSIKSTIVDNQMIVAACRQNIKILHSLDEYTLQKITNKSLIKRLFVIRESTIEGHLNVRSVMHNLQKIPKEFLTEKNIQYGIEKSGVPFVVAAAKLKLIDKKIFATEVMKKMTTTANILDFAHDIAQYGWYYEDLITRSTLKKMIYYNPALLILLPVTNRLTKPTSEFFANVIHVFKQSQTKYDLKTMFTRKYISYFADYCSRADIDNNVREILYNLIYNINPTDQTIGALRYEDAFAARMAAQGKFIKEDIKEDIKKPA